MTERKKRIYGLFCDKHPKFDEDTIDYSARQIVHLNFKGDEFKYCSKCDEWHTIENFFAMKTNWDGLDKMCKVCKKGNTLEATKKWKEENKEHVEEYRKDYEETHKDQRQKYNRLDDEEKEEHDDAHKKKFFKKFAKLVKEKDGDVISTWEDYAGAQKKLWVECEDKHSFEITLNNLELDKWCPICKGAESQICSTCKKDMLLDYFAVDKHAPNNKKYVCKPCANNASKQYRADNADKVADYNKKYREENKEKIQSYYKVSDEQKAINKKDKQDGFFEKFVKTVTQKGGKCVSTEYVSAHDKLKVKCQDGHEFEISPNNLLNNKWCPHCNINYGEEYCRFVLEYFFDVKFKKIRPQWLKTKNNTLLELDGYNEELKIAFEYNGLQHYENVPFFFKTEEEFKKRQEDDEYKMKVCGKEKVNLIVIPYDVHQNDIPRYIYNKCKDLNIKVSKDKLETIKDTDYDKCKSKLEEFKELITEKKGTYIDGQYVSRDSNVTIKCHKNHEFTTKFKYIKNGSWCSTCGLKVKDVSKEKIATTLSEYYQTDKGKENKKQAHEKRSETMAKMKEEKSTNVTHKLCKGECGLDKDISNFCKKSASQDGYQSWCKACTNAKKQADRKK